MTYDVLIRHTNPLPYGTDMEQWFEERHVEARSEEEAFLKTRHGVNDFIACISAWHNRGIEPYSVETGTPDFFTDARRPPRRMVDNGDLRTG